MPSGIQNHNTGRSRKSQVFVLAGLSTTFARTLEVFHLKGLRQILRMKTTYIDGANTNKHIIEQGNLKIHQQTEKGRRFKKVIPLTLV